MRRRKQEKMNKWQGSSGEKKIPLYMKNGLSTVPPASKVADDLTIEKFVSICRPKKRNKIVPVQDSAPTLE